MGIIAKCNNCNEILSEIVNFTENDPCPHCGAISMQIIDDINDEFRIRERIVIKVRKNGEKEVITRITQGDDLYRDTGKWNHLERVIDRENDYYSEKITDPLTGEIIKECNEPLSEHKGHGSAKHKNKNKRN